MTKPTIVTRAGKGSALTWTEGDSNLTNLQDATITLKAGTGGTDVVSDLNGTVTLVAGTNVTLSGDNTAKTVTINSSASGATTLDELTDVVITAAATNDVLVYNGTNWVDTQANTLTVSAASTATTATGATNINISTTTGNTSDTTLYPVMVGAASTGNQLPHIDSTLTYNASTDTLTATNFSGALTGNASTVTVTANNTTSATYYPMFATAATGSLSPNTDTGLTYNPSTGLLTTVGLTTSGTITSSGASAQLNCTGLGVTLSPTGVSGVTIQPTQGMILWPQGTSGGIDNCNIGASAPLAGTFTALTTRGSTNNPKLVLNNTAVSSTAWTTTGIGLRVQAATFTDTSSVAGTVAASHVHAIAAPTMASTNAITVTDAGTLYVAAAPTAGTNTTITNGWAILAGGRIKASAIDATPIGSTTKAAGTFTTMTADTAVLDDIRETVFAIGNSGATTLTPNAANGSIQTITATGNFTLSAFTSPVSGQTITFIITQDATGSRTLTSTMKFSGASKTLSTAANSIDILTVSYIGTTYYASLAKGFA